MIAITYIIVIFIYINNIIACKQSDVIWLFYLQHKYNLQIMNIPRPLGPGTDLSISEVWRLFVIIVSCLECYTAITEY